ERVRGGREPFLVFPVAGEDAHREQHRRRNPSGDPNRESPIDVLAFSGEDHACPGRPARHNPAAQLRVRLRRRQSAQQTAQVLDHVFSSSCRRMRRRARSSLTRDVTELIPIVVAISACVYPSISFRTTTALWSAGNASSAARSAVSSDITWAVEATPAALSSPTSWRRRAFRCLIRAT